MGGEPGIAVGDVIGGRYRVEAWIGRGSMASVARARHLGTGKACALKFVHAHLAARPEFVDLFLKEAQVGGRIGSNPYIVDVFDAAIDPTENIPYLAMELLEGKPLDKHISKNGAMPPALVGTILEQLADALDQAHGAGVIHRDVKPANLFLTQNRQGMPIIKVVDFGIAKVLEDEAQHTATQAGSPAYSAPEQLGPTLRKLAARQGITIALGVSPATDVWALGLSAYELLTGTTPGHYWGWGPGVVLAELMMTVALGDAPPATIRAGPRAHLLPEGFDAWLARCLRKNAAERWPTATEAVRELVRLLEPAMSDEATTLLQSSAQLPAALPPPPGGRETAGEPSAREIPTSVLTQPFPRDTPPLPAPVAYVPEALRRRRVPVIAPHPAPSMSAESSQVVVAGTHVPTPRSKGGLGIALIGAATVVAVGAALLIYTLSPVKEKIGVVATLPSTSSPESSLGTASGGLAIAGFQPGIRVLVDGVERGGLPLTLTDLAPGAHIVRFDAGDRHERIERTVEVKPGVVEDLGAVRLAVLRGQLAIEIATPGATVALFQTAPNGVETKLPVRDRGKQQVMIDLEGEGWTLVAKKKGYQDFTRPISFEDGIAEKAIRVDLISLSEASAPPSAPPPVQPPAAGAAAPAGPKEPPSAPAPVGEGTLHINSIPICKVLLDGKPLGSTPKVSVTVAAGAHQVTFIHPEMGKKTITVTLKPGETKTAIVKF
jgi:serine/threonine protein kinase